MGGLLRNRQGRQRYTHTTEIAARAMGQRRERKKGKPNMGNAIPFDWAAFRDYFAWQTDVPATDELKRF